MRDLTHDARAVHDRLVHMHAVAQALVDDKALPKSAGIDADHFGNQPFLHQRWCCRVQGAQLCVFLL